MASGLNLFSSETESFSTPPGSLRDRDLQVRESPSQTQAAWIYRFLAFQFICQSALLFDSLGGIRTYLRIAAFASSLLLLVLIPQRRLRVHPARTAAICTLALMGLGILHPSANTLPGLAHWLLNIAVWAPLFWASGGFASLKTLRNLLIMLWLFNVLGSVIGVLQVYDPDRFSPSAEFIRSIAGEYSEGLMIERFDGKQVWRPCGLSDSPGGAAPAGSFAVVVGVFFFTLTNGLIPRLATLVGVICGMFCVYVCEVRSILVITLAGAAILLLLQVIQGRLSRAAASLLIIPLIAIGGFGWTKAISGERVESRMKTLVEGSAGSVYYKNRGRFLEYSLLEELPKYPLGAGMGRYGMMQRHFGDVRSRQSALWAEEQFTAWLYDGGLPIVVLAFGAVIITCVTSLRITISSRSQGPLADYAAVVSALNVGWLAVTFNCPFFLGQQGMIFWLLNAVLYSVAGASSRQPSNHKSNTSDPLARVRRLDRLSYEPISSTKSPAR